MVDTSQLTKFHYGIGEVAAMFKVNASLIRFWEQEFSFIKPHKNKKGNRFYTREDIEKINSVYFLVKTKGYTLAGARDHLKMNKRQVDEKLETIQTLEQLKEFLLKLKESI